MKQYLQVVGAISLTAAGLYAADCVFREPYKIERIGSVEGIRDLEGRFYPRGDAANLLEYLQDMDPKKLQEGYQNLQRGKK